MVRVPMSQLAIRSPRLDHFQDPAQVISDRRIRAWTEGLEFDEERVSMCTIVRGEGGGPLRTFSGGLAHENGWHTSAKADRLLHWEGETAFEKLIESDTDPLVAGLNTESVGFEFPLNGKPVRVTIDIEQVAPDGSITLLEMKRTDRDLDDPEYRSKLAYVREVCRRCGMKFRIVFRDEIFRGLDHKANAALFASRGYGSFGKRHRAVLAAHRRQTGGETTYGVLAQAFEPGHAAAGKAVVQAMLVRRLVQMDLTVRLEDESPVTIV